MRKNLSIVLIALAACLTLGCAASDDTPPADASTATTNEATVAVAAYCGDCGHAKGTAECCAEGAEPCNCGMAKGSPLCCKVTADVKGESLCGKCGNVVASESCCVEGADKCSCGMAKGAPLCCKLTPSDE